MALRHSTRKRKLLTALTAAGIIAGTLAAATPASADSRLAVTNPSFIQPYVDPNGLSSYQNYGVDNNGIPGWRVTQGSVDVYGRAASKTGGSSVVESGSQAVDLNGGGPGGIEQTLSTVPGSLVTLTFATKINDHPWCAANAPSVNESLYVQFAGDPDNARLRSLGSVNTPGRYATWQLVRIALPATGRHSRLQFISATSGACGPIITDVDATDNTA
ncbi:DUF642 domain-containing protein [Streptomyces sp. L2]|uniref:DUF642 domain-containing protein n=1 Tax=Streptomyces sp. L2 TaxID=2162665 RepID=UPI0013E947B4|nr:DUF642 domain-containing protein [Streptomyces sp. L2]